MEAVEPSEFTSLEGRDLASDVKLEDADILLEGGNIR